MLKRKITDTLSAWKASPNRKPIILKGCRQCGKTFAAQHFAHANYQSVVYINFFENPGAKDIFAGSLNVESNYPYGVRLSWQQRSLHSQ